MVTTTKFKAIGRLEEIRVNSKNLIRYLHLNTDQGMVWFQVSSKLSAKLAQLQESLQIGLNLELSGERKTRVNNKNSITKNQVIQYKTKELKVMQEKRVKSKVVKPKAKVLFCKKSTCWKKGGKSACKALKQELKARGLNKQVEIRTTGCLKQCKKAPNIVLMPDKARYSSIKNKQVVKLIDKHLVLN